MSAFPTEDLPVAPVSALGRAEAEIRELARVGAPSLPGWTGTEPCGVKDANPEDWHPKVGGPKTARQDAAVARRACDGCPVVSKAPCLAWALQHEVQGVWGGTTALERAALRRLPSPLYEKVDAVLARHDTAREAAARNARILGLVPPAGARPAAASA